MMIRCIIIVVCLLLEELEKFYYCVCNSGCKYFFHNIFYSFFFFFSLAFRFFQNHLNQNNLFKTLIKKITVKTGKLKSGITI